jgi:hypothetical protein
VIKHAPGSVEDRIVPEQMQPSDPDSMPPFKRIGRMSNGSSGKFIGRKKGGETKYVHTEQEPELTLGDYILLSIFAQASKQCSDPKDIWIYYLDKHKARITATCKILQRVGLVVEDVQAVTGFKPTTELIYILGQRLGRALPHNRTQTATPDAQARVEPKAIVMVRQQDRGT